MFFHRVVRDARRSFPKLCVVIGYSETNVNETGHMGSGLDLTPFTLARSFPQHAWVSEKIRVRTVAHHVYPRGRCLGGKFSLGLPEEMCGGASWLQYGFVLVNSWRNMMQCYVNRHRASLRKTMRAFP